MCQIVTTQIGHSQLAEDVVKNGCCILDRIVTHHHASGLKTGEGECVYVFFKRHAVLQAKRDRDREVVHQRAECSAFLVHVDEDLADAAIFVLTGCQVHFVATNGSLLSVALAAVWQLFTVTDSALNDALNNTLCNSFRTCSLWLCEDVINGVFCIILIVFQQLSVQRLRQLGTIAVKRVSFKAKLPGEHVASLQSSTLAVFAMLMVLEIAPEMNG